MKKRPFHSLPFLVAGNDGPTAIVTGGDHVDLVVIGLSVFCDEQPAVSTPGDPLRVSVSKRIDVGAGKWIVVRHLAVDGHAQDLAGEVRDVLWPLPVLGPSGRHIQIGFP